MEDIFDAKNISPMLMVEESSPFDSVDYIYELKLDGIRCVVYLDEQKTELRNKRNKNLNDIYPELKGIHSNVKQRCILDGELVVISDGKPDFYELQRRSLMTNKIKIEQAGKTKPVSFVAFDILYVDGKQLTDLPLWERKEILKNTVNETNSLAVSRFVSEKGVVFFNLALQQNLEGVVAKKRDSKYYFEKRTKDWIKFKVKKDADLIICGYVPDEPGKIKSLALGAYKDGVLIEQGHVMFGVSRAEEKVIKDFAINNPNSNPFKDKSTETVWLKPELVCTVEFMMRSENGHMRQPVFKGLRVDKRAEECIVS